MTPREIRFRAISKETGKFVYGFYVQSTAPKSDVVTHSIIVGNTWTTGASKFWGVDSHEIDVGTLGQFTGLCDSRHIETYEGDIIEEAGHSFEVAYNNKDASFMIKPLGEDEFVEWFYAPNSRVIGNIHEKD